MTIEYRCDGCGKTITNVANPVSIKAENPYTDSVFYAGQEGHFHEDLDCITAWFKKLMRK